jgi:hypothetical protein
MCHLRRQAGLAILATAAVIGIVGCSQDRYEAAYGPDYYYYDGYYYGDGHYDGYYYRQRYLDSDRNRYGYHIQRDYDGWGRYRSGGRQDISRDVGRSSGGRQDISRDVGSGGSRGMDRGGSGRGGGRR